MNNAGQCFRAQPTPKHALCEVKYRMHRISPITRDTSQFVYLPTQQSTSVSASVEAQSSMDDLGSNNMLPQPVVRI